MAATKRTRKNKLKRDIEKRRNRIRLAIRIFFTCCGFVFLIGALSFALVYAYDFFTQTAHFRATIIEVEGNQRLSVEEIFEQGKLKKDMNILSLNLGLTQKRLVAHPWIAQAAVQREIPSAIHIRITEQQPIAIVQLGKPFLMNAKGEIFKALAEDDPSNMPEIWGLEPSDFREGKNKPSRSKKAVMRAFTLITKSREFFPAGSVRNIQADKDTGISVTAFKPEKRFKLGFGNYEFKLKRLNTLMHFLSRKTYMADYQSIDITDAKRIVIQPVKTPPESS